MGMKCCYLVSLKDIPNHLLCGWMETGGKSTPAPLLFPCQRSFLKSPVRFASRRGTKTTTHADSRTDPQQPFTFQVNVYVHLGFWYMSGNIWKPSQNNIWSCCSCVSWNFDYSHERNRKFSQRFCTYHKLLLFPVMFCWSSKAVVWL